MVRLRVQRRLRLGTAYAPALRPDEPPTARHLGGHLDVDRHRRCLLDPPEVGPAGVVVCLSAVVSRRLERQSPDLDVALLLLATPLAAAAASAVKLYALVPLLFRPRHLVVACLFLAVTLLILPWRLYLDAGGGVSGHLADAWNGSAWRLPFLVVPTAIALWVLRRDGADWWSIPAIWPATQFYYVSSALPAVVGRPFLAALIAVPAPLMTPIIVIALAIRIRIERLDPAAWDNLVSRLRASITRSHRRRGSP